MTDRLIVTGLSGARVQVSYRPDEMDNAEAYGEPVAFASPLSTEDLGDLAWYLESYVGAPYAQYAERGAVIEGKLKAWGEALFRALFGVGKPRDAYARAREHEADLEISSEDAGFLALPWELLWDPERPTPLALNLRGLDRSCEVSEPLIPVPPGEELRVLMVIARPAGLEDVDFQMVARPLRERLPAVRGKVRLDVLRPPTLKALAARLTAALEVGAAYHAVHFDGHGTYAGGGTADMYEIAGGTRAGYLMFETADGAKKHSVPAGDFAGVIKRGGVPLVILNACQSGTLGGEDATTSASVATRLLAEGARSVVAMSHKVYAVAAAEFMAAFYETLFNGKSVREAVTAGRLQLKYNPERPSQKGPIALQDWMIPVLYARSEMRFPGLASKSISAGRPSFAAMLAEMRAGATETAEEEGIEAEGGVFVGRGAEFFKLELAARTARVALIQGPAGTGKTELAKGFARWWRDTGGTDDPKLVFFHSFESGLASFGLDGALGAIAPKIMPSDMLGQLGPEQLRALMLRTLREHAMLLIWDNFESVHSMTDPASSTPPLDATERRKIADFLAAVAAPGGRSTILITSRSEEVWLGDTRRIELGGLPPLEAAEYAGTLLIGLPIARVRPEKDRAGFEALMAWLDGHPLSMKLILPLLETRSSAELLKSLKGQELLPPGFEGEGRTKRLGASIRYSLDHLDAEARALLPALCLFEGVADADALAIMSEQPEVPMPFANVSHETWSMMLDRAAGLGLLTKLRNGLYHMHPALPAYLAAEWRHDVGAETEARRSALLDALITAHAKLGSWLDQQIEGGDTKHAFAVMAAEQRTMGVMIVAALSAANYKAVLCILQPLFDFLAARGLTREQASWIDRCLDAVEGADGAVPDFGTEAGELWLSVKNWQAHLALDAHVLDRAEMIQRDILRILESAPFSQDRERRLAVAFNQLGKIAQDRGALDEAEKWCLRSLEIKEALKIRPGMANSYNQLGILSHLRGTLKDAENWFRKALSVYQSLDNSLGIIKSYHLLAMVVHDSGELAEAEEWYRKSLALREALDDRVGMAQSYHQLGNIAQDRGALEESEDWHKKALAIREALNDRPGRAQSYHQLGIVAQARGQIDEANNWYTTSLSIKKALNDHPGMAKSYHQLGTVAQRRGAFDEADDWYGKALAILETLDDRPGISRSYHQLGIVAQKRGLHDLAEAWYRKALVINEALSDYSAVAITYGQLGLLAKARNDDFGALCWFIRCATLFEPFGHPATSPAPRHLARLMRGHGEETLAKAWREVTGQVLPASVLETLRNWEDRNAGL